MRRCAPTAARAQARWDAFTGIEYAYWYGCLECGTMTAQRPTAAESAEDVVWVAAKQRRSKQAA